MSVQFLLDLIDKTSGPALAATSALAKVEAKMKAIQASTGIDLSKLFRGSTGPQRNDMGQFVASAKEGTEGLSGGALGATAALGGLATAMAVVAVAGIGLVGAGASYAAEMAGFRGNAEFAFRYIAGSQEKAGEILTMADELARAMGAKTTDVTESIRELMGGGFDAEQAKAITAAVGDVKAMNPKANVEAIATQLAQMKGAGKVLAEDLKPLLNAGVNDDIFYQVLREMTGEKDQAKLKKLMETGKVTSEQGINAILETVKRMGGGGALGSVAADKAATSVSGAIANAKAMFERLFIAINSGAAGGVLLKMAHMAASLFDPAQPGGKRLLDLLNQIAAAAGAWLGQLDLAAIVQGMLMLAGAAGRVVEFIAPLGQGLFQGLSEAGRMVMEVVAAASGTDAAAGSSAQLAEALRMVGMAVGYVVVGVATAGALVGWFAAQIARVATFVMGAAGAIGVALVDGIGGGIEGAWAKLLERLSTLTGLLPEAVRKVLGIASPSRVMMELGGYTTEGFNAGLQRGPQPAETMAQMMTPPPAPAGPLAPSPVLPGMVAGAAFAAGGAAPQINLSISVDATGRPDAEEVAALTAAAGETMLTRIFERLALESGAGALAP